LRLWF